MVNNFKNNGKLKKEIEELFKIKGEVRGAGIRGAYLYLKDKLTEEQIKIIKIIEEKLSQFGYPIKIDEIKAMSWYPVGLAGLLLLVAKQVLNFNETKIEELGKAAARFSLIEKLLGRYFLSPQKVYQMGSKHWQKYFNVGILETPEINLEKKYSILRLKNFKVHPLLCIYLKGYAQGVASFVIKAKKFRCEETKCMFKGDPYHEFVVRWK